jgi:HAD superfamily hydrolase (TIGR01484 family)
MKKMIAFDLDDTLNVAKTPLTPEMVDLFGRLLDHYEVCVISGQKYEEFQRQIITPLGAQPLDRLKNLHLMVAQGTQYYTFDGAEWKLVYSFPLTDQQISAIDNALETAARELGLWTENPIGEINENRISQVTFSALGQAAGTEEKYAWDPDHKKREKIAARAKELAPEFDYEIAGTTSINVFVPGTNKTFGMNKLMEYVDLDKDGILYFGDMVQPGGNDYPVVEMGIDTIAVEKWQDTAYALRGILGVS